MTNTRHKDAQWNCGVEPTVDGAQLAVLMDIRDELKAINRVLGCSNFLMIPSNLDQIRKNTAKPRKSR
jgi:hypothetical protein